MLVYVPLFAAALWSNILDYALFAAFHSLAARTCLARVGPSRAPATKPPSISSRLRRIYLHLRLALCRHRRDAVIGEASGDLEGMTSQMLLPPDSVELTKKRVGENHCMEMRRSASPQIGNSPVVASVKRTAVEAGNNCKFVQMAANILPLYSPVKFFGGFFPPLLYFILRQPSYILFLLLHPSFILLHNTPLPTAPPLLHTIPLPVPPPPTSSFAFLIYDSV